MRNPGGSAMMPDRAKREDIRADDGDSDKIVAGFRARCAADAQLYADGSLELRDAVDRSQQYAEAYGLVQAVGQDAVQAIMAEAFAGLKRRYVDPIITLDIARMFNTQHCPPPLDDGEVVRIASDIAAREESRRKESGHE